MHASSLSETSGASSLCVVVLQELSTRLRCVRSGLCVLGSCRICMETA